MRFLLLLLIALWPRMALADMSEHAVNITDDTDKVEVTTAGAAHVNLRNAAGTEIGTSTTPIYNRPVYLGSKVRYDDMNVANGGTARGTSISTTYVTLYNYSGSGQLFSFLVTFEGNLVGADIFIVKLEIDGVTNFEISTDDLGTQQLYNLGTAGAEATMGFSSANNTVRFTAPGGLGLQYNSSVKISIKKTVATTKLFRAGAVYLTKES